MDERSILTVHVFDRAHHRPGTVGYDEARCTWGGGCHRPAVYSIEAQEPAATSWWTACDRHADGLSKIDGVRLVWVGPPASTES